MTKPIKADAVIPHPYGSDFEWPVAFTDEDGLPLDLTGGNVEVLESSTSFAALSAVFTDAAAGEVLLSMPWGSGLARGSSHWFILRRRPAGGAWRATDFVVNVQ